MTSYMSKDRGNFSFSVHDPSVHDQKEKFALPSILKKTSVYRFYQCMIIRTKSQRVFCSFTREQLMISQCLQHLRVVRFTKCSYI